MAQHALFLFKPQEPSGETDAFTWAGVGVHICNSGIQEAERSQSEATMLYVACFKATSLTFMAEEEEEGEEKGRRRREGKGSGGLFLACSVGGAGETLEDIVRVNCVSGVGGMGT